MTDEKIEELKEKIEDGKRAKEKLDAYNRLVERKEWLEQKLKECGAVDTVSFSKGRSIVEIEIKDIKYTETILKVLIQNEILILETEISKYNW